MRLQRLVTPALLAVVVAAPPVEAAPRGPSRSAATTFDAVGADPWHDFDNNGFEDLVVGLPAEDVRRASDGTQQVDAGAVQVLYGAGDDSGLSVRNQLWTQQNIGAVGPEARTPEAGDRFGAAVAAGDFDGDGYGDLAIGVPGEDITTSSGRSTDTGMVIVMSGGPNGLEPGPQVIRVPESGTRPPEPGILLGSGLAALDTYQADGLRGDDGIADLAMGFPGVAVGGPMSAGTSGTDRRVIGGFAIAIGRTSGFDLRGQGLRYYLCFNDDAPRTEPQDGDRCGSVMTAGDFGHESEDDLALGTPGRAVGGLPGAGAVWVMYDGDFTAETAVNQSLYQATSVASASEKREAGDHFGAALAAGDFDDDGWDDLAVGVPDEDLTVSTSSGPVSRADAGVVQVYRGSPTGFRPTSASDPFVPAHQKLSQDSRIGVEQLADLVEAGDRFGAALASGDFGITDQGRNIHDLAVGVPGEDVGSKADAGAVNVVYGRVGGLTGLAGVLWTQDQEGVQDVAEAGDRFGAGLASIDTGKNSYDDLAVGVPLEDVASAGGVRTDAGLVHMLYGSRLNPASGLQPTADRQLWHQDVAGIADLAEAGDRFGGVIR